MAWSDKVIEPSNRSVIIGLDPGAGGALACLDSKDWTLEVFDTPHLWTIVNGKRRRIVDVKKLSDLVVARRPLMISTEKVHAMPQMDVKGIFTFGRFYGQVEMLACMAHTEFFETDPAVWKAAMSVNSDKDISRQRAGQLIPAAAAAGLFKRKTDHDRAEACMLALFGAFNKGLNPRNITMKG